MGIGLAALFAGVAACDEEPTGTNGNGGGGGNISDPAIFQAFIEAGFLEGFGGVVDGFNRLLVAVEAGPPGGDGVRITEPTPGNFSAEIDIDLDGDGSRETTLFGAGSGDILVGASLSITGITDPNEPTLTVSFAATVLQTGPTGVVLENISGSVSADPPGSGNAATVDITSGVIAVDPVVGAPTGFLDTTVTGEGESLDARCDFMADGSVDFSGPTFTGFTVGP
jgi:hypothetical protein